MINAGNTKRGRNWKSLAIVLAVPVVVISVVIGMAMFGSNSGQATIEVQEGRIEVAGLDDMVEGRRYQMTLWQYRRYGDRKAEIEGVLDSRVGPEEQLRRMQFELAEGRNQINVRTTVADAAGNAWFMMESPDPATVGYTVHNYRNGKTHTEPPLGDIVSTGGTPIVDFVAHILDAGWEDIGESVVRDRLVRQFRVINVVNPEAEGVPSNMPVTGDLDLIARRTVASVDEERDMVLRLETWGVTTNDVEVLLDAWEVLEFREINK
jgi:hypothetical protein